MPREFRFTKEARLRVEPGMYEAIQRLARRHGVGIASAMRMALARGLEDLGEVQPPPIYAKDAA